MNPKYIPARSIEEALEYLHRYGDVTRILTGGTDVMVGLRADRMAGKRLPEFLLDLSGIPELRAIRFHENQLVVGAGASFRELEGHPVIREKTPLLSSASSRIGSPQVRYLATLGGNVGTSSPAGDGITPLVALSAAAWIRSSSGSRSLPVAELITAPGKNGLADDELIVSFSLNCPSQPQACFFDKVMRRQAVAVARLNLAVQLALDPLGRISTAQIAVGAIFPRPGRLGEVEKLIANQVPSEELFAVAGQAAARVMLRNSGQRPSMAYKVPALQKMVAWGLKQASRPYVFF